MTKVIYCMEVGRRLAAINIQKHMTQQQETEAAGIATPYYSQIETGNKTASSYMPSIIEALKSVAIMCCLAGFPT